MIKDIVLKVGRRRFSTNREVLERSSPVLKAKLSELWRTSDSQDDICEISEEFVDPLIVKDLLEFFYTGNIVLNTDNAHAICEASHYLDIPYLLSISEQFLIERVSPANVLPLFVCANRLQLQSLWKRCYDCIYQDPKKILLNEKLLEDFDEEERRLIMKAREGSSSFQLYCFGGYTRNYKPILEVSQLDVSSGEWNRPTTMPTHRAMFSGAVIGSKIYICGGFANHQFPLDTMDVFDCNTKTWTERQRMPEPRRCFGIAALNGYIYAAGGTGSFCSDWGPLLASVDRYCIATDEWESVAPMNTPRACHQLVELNGLLYAIGGQQINTVEQYNPTTNKWKMVASSSFPHEWAGATAHYGKVFVCSYKGFEVYTPETNQWKTLAWLADSKTSRTLVSIGGKLWSLGGGNVLGTRSISEYDIITDTWRKRRAMDVERSDHCSFVVQS